MSSSSKDSYSGSCACGAVQYTIHHDQDDDDKSNISGTTSDPHKALAICHCTTCQAWSGGMFVYIEVKAENVTLLEKHKEFLTLWQSSEYGERAFCKICGSSVYCRITAPGPMEGIHHFGAGTLHEKSFWNHGSTHGTSSSPEASSHRKIQVTKEFFVDRKPHAYAFHEDNTSQKMTSTEFFALFADEEKDKVDEK